ncbi:hypothetical protein FJ428_22535 [Mesorhizobium sp. B2-8-1]|nr:hypothetical protein FJ428_22535 [Mesorhizobium sp. B2-8-1]
MKIGIIGAGNIGITLAQKLVASGHAVNRANSRRPETIRDLACDLGATAASKEEAVQGVRRSFLQSRSASIPISPASLRRAAALQMPRESPVGSACRV